MKASMTKISIFSAVLAAALMASASVPAAEPEEAAEALRAQREELELHRREMLEAIEESRFEAERAAAEARDKAEILRLEAERLRREAEQIVREAGEAQAVQMREIEQARRDLSRTHRELREASQEIARAHRELGLVEDRRVRTRMINLGDRAMLGVILGDVSDEGISIVGLSPDGPAERAGLKNGDVLVSVRGESLAEADGRVARDVIFEVLSEVEDGEEISVGVLRDGKRLDFMVKPEKREPASWATLIRLPEAPLSPDHPDHPLAPEVIAIPPIDTVRLAEQAEAMVADFDAMRAVFEGRDYAFEFDAGALSELSADALSQARVMFGPPAAVGIRFAEINEGLGSYFGADRGVLVLEAPEENPLTLKSGDVVLSVGDSEVHAVSDIFRALRDLDPGDEVQLTIKRAMRDESIKVTMPENRLGMFGHGLSRHAIRPN